MKQGSLFGFNQIGFGLLLKDQERRTSPWFIMYSLLLEWHWNLLAIYYQPAVSEVHPRTLLGFPLSWSFAVLLFVCAMQKWGNSFSWKYTLSYQRNGGWLSLSLDFSFRSTLSFNSWCLHCSIPRHPRRLCPLPPPFPVSLFFLIVHFTYFKRPDALLWAHIYFYYGVVLLNEIHLSCLRGNASITSVFFNPYYVLVLGYAARGKHGGRSICSDGI